MNNQREICVGKRVELHSQSSHAARVVKYEGLLICKLAVYRVKSSHGEDYNLSQSHRYRDVLQPSAVLARSWRRRRSSERWRAKKKKNQFTLYLESLMRYMPLTEPDSSGYVAENYVFAQLPWVHERQTNVNPGRPCFPAVQSSPVQFCRSRYENAARPWLVA